MSVTMLDRLADRAMSECVPISALFELTGRCNLDCCHCYLDIAHPPGEMTTEQAIGVVDQLAEAGTSFSQVLNDYRHQLAKRLLAKTDESIAEIVYLTGFSEPSTFYRAFKRWEGLTPVEYRRRKQDAAGN